MDRYSTQWASWVIEGKESNVYFSGDSGYSPSFKEIGKRFGSFDLAFVECGQYNFRWPDIHMTPEETVQASVDLNAKALLPIHWGAFDLAPHSWTDPAERAYIEAEKRGINIKTPYIGERFLVNYPAETTPWWRSVN